jgi:hypothetical protein
MTTVVAGRTLKSYVGSGPLQEVTQRSYSVGIVIFTAVVVPKPSSRDAD